MNKEYFIETLWNSSEAYKEFFLNEEIKYRWKNRFDKFVVECPENDLNVLTKVMQGKLLDELKKNNKEKNLIGKKVFKRILNFGK